MHIHFNKKMLVPAAIAAGALGWLSLTSSGCELIASVDRTKITTGPGGGTPTGMGGTAGMGGQGGGGEAGTMCIRENCPGEDTTCRVRDCDDGGECINVNTAVDTSCDEFMGMGGGDPASGVCNGTGDCVECTPTTEDTQCMGTDKCINNECAPASCGDGVIDFDLGETDTNGDGTECGGPCPPCANMDQCNGTDDCASGFCVGGTGQGGMGSMPAGTCTACGGDGDCEGADGPGLATWCNVGVCDADFGAGMGTCDRNAQCNGNAGSAFCAVADGVCCDSACNATCESCLAAKSVTADGVCGAIDLAANVDPDNECTANTLACKTNDCSSQRGFCGQATGVCRAAGAGDDAVCNPAESCPGGTGSCPADVVAPAGTDCADAITQPTCNPNDVCAAGVCNEGGAASSSTACTENAGGDPGLCDGMNPGTCIDAPVGGGGAGGT